MILRYEIVSFNLSMLCHIRDGVRIFNDKAFFFPMA